ncbi:unnamed protein product [Paramecium sonneborni]|uniref:Uncharacterized protein n=1 Tax=Paramecium sonneborni TaxID=65129 RepID=A0A8S1K256_9CILI|nr:unnamed protein product [Paramecium sonneborni]
MVNGYEIQNIMKKGVYSIIYLDIVISSVDRKIQLVNFISGNLEHAKHVDRTFVISMIPYNIDSFAAGFPHGRVKTYKREKTGSILFLKHYELLLLQKCNIYIKQIIHKFQLEEYNNLFLQQSNFSTSLSCSIIIKSRQFKFSLSILLIEDQQSLHQIDLQKLYSIIIIHFQLIQNMLIINLYKGRFKNYKIQQSKSFQIHFTFTFHIISD